jgi:hypothetical protein
MDGVIEAMKERNKKLLKIDLSHCPKDFSSWMNKLIENDVQTVTILTEAKSYKPDANSKIPESAKKQSVSRDKIKDELQSISTKYGVNMEEIRNKYNKKTYEYRGG